MRASNGDWICVYNDTEEGRHSLAVSLSTDEGRSWKWTRHLENRVKGQGRFHYPSIIEGSDDRFHVTYSYHIENENSQEPKGKSIKYANFDLSWLQSP